MNLIFADETKIKTFAKIQDSMSCLESNSGDESIELIINEIPKSFLDQKDDLMVICCIFGYYGRNNIKNRIGNTVKLFKKIMDPIKKHLQNESSFFWNIFGSIFYLKRWMYEEGLISLQYIIQISLNESNFTTFRYFMPEIFEKEREIFEKEFKDYLPTEFSEENINEFKELRNKHFQWLCESNDYNDPLYREIEKNQLRLAIKQDDIDSFQSIISNSNTPLNSQIQESLLENTYYRPHSVSLIDFAIDFNAVKIAKYLIMNGVKIEEQAIFNSICCRDYELIHIVESKNAKDFKNDCLFDSIQCWNLEMAKYSIENYGYDYLECEDIKQEKANDVTTILYYICYSMNFIFFDQIFLPFLKKNPKIVEKEIHNIIAQTIMDNSCFFMKEFMKYPEIIDINHHIVDFYIGDEEEEEEEEEKEFDTFLSIAIKERNSKAIEILLNHPNINIEEKIDYTLPFHLAIYTNSDLKILDLFFNHPKFDIDAQDDYSGMNPLGAAIIRGNFYAIGHIMERFPDCINSLSPYFIKLCFKDDRRMCAKILVKSLLSNNEDKSDEKIIEELKTQNGLEEYADKLRDILKDLRPSLK